MAKSFAAPINPKALQWARESLGIAPASLAKKLKVSTDTVSQWETGEAQPSFVQLKKIADKLRRPTPVFFLQEIPKDPALPKDYRFIADRTSTQLSEKALEEIRFAQRRHEVALELAQDTDMGLEKKFPDRAFSPKDSPEEVAQFFRRHVATIAADYFESVKTDSENYKAWKRTIEGLGILVFQSSLGPVKQIRGLSVYFDEMPIILINSKDSIRGKSFTLLHEMAHLLLRDAGVCNVEVPEDKLDPNSQVEQFCNAFSAAVLVPQDRLLKAIVGLNFDGKLSDRLLLPLAKQFFVSLEVIARRLLTLRKITLNQYQAKRHEIIANYDKYNKPAFGRATYAERIVSANGFNFTDIVLRSLAADKIAPNQVTDFLGIKVKYIKAVDGEIQKLRKGSE